KTVRLYAPFVLPAYLRHPRARNVRRLLERAVFHDPRYADDAWVDTIVEQWKPRSRRATFIATGNALRRPDASVAADLERVRARTRVVWGREDPQFDRQIGEAAARRIPGAKFAAIEDCGHFPMVGKPTETAEIVSELTEDFLLAAPHLRIVRTDQRRLHVVAAGRLGRTRSPSAKQDLAPFPLRDVHVSEDPLLMILRRERPQLRRLLERIPDSDGPNAGRKPFQEIIPDRLMDEQTRSRDARLSLVVVRGEQGSLDRGREVRVREHDVRAFPAEFQE